MSLKPRSTVATSSATADRCCCAGSMSASSDARGGARVRRRPSCSQRAQPAREAHLRAVLRLGRRLGSQHAAPRSGAAVGRAEELASEPTLSRLASLGQERAARALHEVLLEQLIASRKTAPMSWCSTSMPRTCRRTASRKAHASTPTTTTAATCRCACSAASTCWRACRVQADAIRPACSARSSSCSRGGFARPIRG